MPSITTLLACLLLAFVGSSQAKYHGDGTAYSGTGEKDDTGFNACQYGELSDRWERMYAALPNSMFDRGDCGRCIRVCGLEGSNTGCVVAKVVDACASCSWGDVDLSTDALEAATGYRWDRKRIEWDWVDCGSPDEPEDSGSDATADTSTSSDTSSDTGSDSGSEGSDGIDGSASGSSRSSSGSGPQAYELGHFKDWTMECEGSRVRCPNLAMASMGYQCTNVGATRCCLTADGKHCEDIDSVEDVGAAAIGWTGALPAAPAPAPAPAAGAAAQGAPYGWSQAAPAPAEQQALQIQELQQGAPGPQQEQAGAASPSPASPAATGAAAAPAPATGPSRKQRAGTKRQ